MSVCYDAFEHLRRALFWSVDRPVFALTFYADDAGKRDDDEYVVAAGFLGTVAQWERFNPDWRLKLASAGLPYFHANEFFNGADVFTGWNTPERKKGREELLQALGGIIGEYALHSFTAGVHVTGWMRANDEYMLDEAGFTPFALAARIAVQRARQWAEQNGHKVDEIECIFDQGCEDWGKLQRRLKVDFGIEAVPRDKKKIRPLQAADWLAYEEFREIPKRVAGSKQKMRGSYLPLLQVPFDPILFHEKEIRESICLVSAMNVPARSPQARGLVRLRYDWKRIKRIGRAYKRLGNRITGFRSDAASPVSADQDTPYVWTNPEVAALVAESDMAKNMRNAYNQLAEGILARMRVGSQEDQDRLRNECTDALRAQREWMEKHIAALEKLVAIVEAQKD